MKRAIGILFLLAAVGGVGLALGRAPDATVGLSPGGRLNQAQVSAQTAGVAACFTTSNGTHFGAYGVTPVTRPAAWTLTYNTGSRTSATITSHAITDSSGGTPSTSAIAAITQSGNTGSADLVPTQNALATLAAELALVKADLLAVKQNCVQVVKDLQGEGLEQ